MGTGPQGHRRSSAGKTPGGVRGHSPLNTFPWGTQLVAGTLSVHNGFWGMGSGHAAFWTTFPGGGEEGLRGHRLSALFKWPDTSALQLFLRVQRRVHRGRNHLRCQRGFREWVSGIQPTDHVSPGTQSNHPVESPVRT